MLWEAIKNRLQQFPSSYLKDTGRIVRYEELTAMVEACALQLRQKKYGILCRSELNTAIALLACMAAGATAVPLSYRYGEVHSRRIIEAVGVTNMLTDDSGKLEITEGNALPERENLSGVAVIMCTSGTTGTPKGAMITQDNLGANLLDIQRYFPLSSADRLLIVRPLYHCAVLTGEFLIALLRGASVIFTSAGFKPIEIARRIREEKATVLCGTPTLFHHLGPMYGRMGGEDPLRILVVSGECMTEPVAQEMKRYFSAASIYSVYGLTEASPRVASLSPEEFFQYPTSVGRPLASIQAKIIGEDGEELPRGSCGELIIRGPNVMKGYYANWEATKRTVKNGWLHTGDMAIMDDGGRLYIKGRRDNMMIRAGMNIYPQEIENILLADAHIMEALAYGETGKAAGERICLSVVPAVQGLTGADVLRICQARLPGYAWPDKIEIVEQLEHNASGKLIRRNV